MKHNYWQVYDGSEKDDLNPMEHPEQELDSDGIAAWEEGFINGQDLIA